MQTFRYSPELFARIRLITLSSFAVSALLTVIVDWFSSPARHYTNKIPGILMLGISQSVIYYTAWRAIAKAWTDPVFTVDAGRLSAGSFEISRRDATRLEITRTEFTLHGSATRPPIRVMTGLDGYNELLGALRSWQVPVTESTKNPQVIRMIKLGLIVPMPALLTYASQFTSPTLDTAFFYLLGAGCLAATIFAFRSPSVSNMARWALGVSSLIIAVVLLFVYSL